MWHRGRFIIAACAAISLTGAVRTALAAGTCSFDLVSGVMTAEITGPTTLRPQAARILMDNVPCGEATSTNVDTIRVTGSGNLILNMRSRAFAPGRTPEADGVSEIEVDIQLSSGVLSFVLDSTSNQMAVVGGGIDFFGDGDLDDFTIAGVTIVSILAGDGDDLIDGGDSVRQIDGGPGNDVIRGAGFLFGNTGNDILIAGTIGAFFHDGPGDDISIGGDGGDRFFADGAANGADHIIGGGGLDMVDYLDRVTGVQIALDGTSESGELSDGVPIEGDLIAADVEDAESGPGDDILIGNDLPNRLRDWEGNDLVDGGGGDDHLDGRDGDDDLVGGDGDDVLLGLAGNDFLDGGAGNDNLVGQDGDDEMVGGDGNDVMSGIQGNDTFLGGPGNDIMLGGPGNDRLEGGDGLDSYRGNQDNDHLEAPADGFIEEIRCGHGDDTFVAGPEDIVQEACFP
jgi:Ca2+-binding RTX toxin-like protein